MFAQCQDRGHAGRMAAVAGWWPQGRHGPGRGVDGGQPMASLQLRVVPEHLHVVDPGVGDPGLIEPPQHLVGRQLAEHGVDQALQCRLLGHTLCIRCKAWIGRQTWLLQHRGAKSAPLALGLHTQHHRLPIAGFKGSVWVRIPRHLDSDSSGNWTAIPRQTGQFNRVASGV